MKPNSKKPYVPSGYKMTNALVRAHEEGKPYSKRPPSDQLPPVKRVFYTPTEKTKRKMKSKITLPHVTFAEDKK